MKVNIGRWNRESSTFFIIDRKLINFFLTTIYLRFLKPPLLDKENWTLNSNINIITESEKCKIEENNKIKKQNNFLKFVEIIIKIFNQGNKYVSSEDFVIPKATLYSSKSPRMFDTDVIKWTRIFFLAKIGFITQCTFLLARYNESKDLLTFLCHSNNTICQTSLKYPPVFWGLGTDNSRWRPGLENTMDAEAIWNPIHAFLPMHCSMCEMVHCHAEKGLFSSSNVIVSSWFREPIDLIIQ